MFILKLEPVFEQKFHVSKEQRFNSTKGEGAAIQQKTFN